MTIETSARAGTNTSAPAGLADLVGDTAQFFDQVWGRRTAVYRCGPATELLSTADVWRELDCGALVAPYFGILREDPTPTVAGITETRIIQTKPRPGYAKPAAVREQVAAGHIFVLRQLEDWNRRIGALVDALRTECRAQAGTAAHLCPTGSAGVVAHADGAHVFVVQLAGRMRWLVGETADASTTVMEAGDVLYIPARRVRQAAPCGSDDALYLVLSLQQPTAMDLAELALARFLESSAAADTAGTHHFMSPQEKIAWLRAEVRAHLAGHAPHQLAEEAVLRRREGGAHHHA